VLNESLDSVEERLVETGVLSEDLLEIRSGLKPGERVAVDGAGFLTNGAVVSVQQR